MELEFDTAKNQQNIEKHGVSLILAAVILQSLAGEVEDKRHDYGEVRINAFGFAAGRLFVCTYTMRGDVHRIISVRKASRQEQQLWLS